MLAIVDHEQLYLRWARWFTQTATESLVQSSFADLQRAYTEAQRAYHTLRHLQELFTVLDAWQMPTMASDLAVWYHDYIYQPGSPHNESRSAEQAQVWLQRLEVNREVKGQVDYMIRCTQRHHNPEQDVLTSVFLDADMAILAAPRERYQVYLQQVEQEHRRLPGWMYRRGRRRFVKQLLASPQIFYSAQGYQQCEALARDNLQWEWRQH